MSLTKKYVKYMLYYKSLLLIFFLAPIGLELSFSYLCPNVETRYFSLD